MKRFILILVVVIAAVLVFYFVFKGKAPEVTTPGTEQEEQVQDEAPAEEPGAAPEAEEAPSGSDEGTTEEE